ncbi:MAG: carboxypeptidase-like regulatory domain-containing protein [Bacteroidia bacterium]
MKYYVIFILVLFAQLGRAQTLISGKIIDSKSKEPLPSVNVYINNTSIGTFTDSFGNFKLVVPGNGKVELIISHLVYRKKTLVVQAEDSKDIVIEMVYQNNILKPVEITAKKPSKTDIRNWTALFALNLIGDYKGVSTQCKILNPEVLYFDYDKQSGQLQVFARRPILVENLALGYLVRLELDEFKYDFKTDDVVYNYAVFFETLALPRNKMVQVLRNRKQMYAGSTMHFMRSLHCDSLDSLGFAIYKYSSIQNAERARVYKNVLSKIEYAYANQSNPRIELARLFTSEDTVRYYYNVLQQDRVVSFDTIRLNPKALLKHNQDSTIINFNSTDTLMINYSWDKPSFSKPVYETKFVGNTYRRYKRVPTLNWQSYMYFFNKDGINAQTNGFYPELGLFIYGDMGNRRLAGLLPFDYNPDE